MRLAIKAKEIIVRLLKSDNSPTEIALGVSLGVFIAILPLYGFHTMLVILFALLVPHANKIAILLGTNISLPPTVPFITWAGYEIGRYFFAKEYPPLTPGYFKHINFQAIKESYPVLFLGSLILGTAAAVTFYLLTWCITKRIEHKKRHGS